MQNRTPCLLDLLAQLLMLDASASVRENIVRLFAQHLGDSPPAVALLPDYIERCQRLASTSVDEPDGPLSQALAALAEQLASQHNKPSPFLGGQSDYLAPGELPHPVVTAEQLDAE